MQISNEDVNLNTERTVTIVGIECGASIFSGYAKHCQHNQHNVETLKS